MAEGEHHRPDTSARVLIALVIGQLGLHSAMAGLRMASPLQLLREGYSEWNVGLLLALFAAAPVVMAMHAGRMADRHGYHRPVRLAVLISAGGMVMVVASTFVAGPLRFAALAIAGMATGTGANLGMLTIQRTAGLAARDNAERVRLFSWLGVAPSFSNVIGPVSAGFVIDAAGFRWAYLLLLLMPLATLVSARSVPHVALAARAVETRSNGTRDLLRAPGLKRLLFVNWMLAMCWDVHSFAVPILGHERGFSATTIGLVLGTFTLSVSAVRLVLPALAHRLRERTVIRGAMLGTAVVFAGYPLATSPWAMGSCAVLLGITLGVVQPMIMSTLHHLTPDNRHGETLAVRSMAMNLSSTLMPIVFGAAGSVVGAALLFWIVGAGVGAGSWVARRLRTAEAAGSAR